MPEQPPGLPPNYAVSKLFGFRTLSALGDEQFRDTVLRLMERAQVHCAANESIAELLEKAYTYLAFHYRCEYVYKNEVTDQLFLARHNPASATLLREVQTGGSIADIVIVNGKTTAYEIKSDLDNTSKLEGQIDDYLRVFDQVYVVTTSAICDAIQDYIPGEVGIIKADGQMILETHRPARFDESRIAPMRALQMMRKGEILEAFNQEFGTPPEMGSGVIVSYCRQGLLTLPTKQIRQHFRRALKSRKVVGAQYELVREGPHSLKYAFLDPRLTEAECSRLASLFR